MVIVSDIFVSLSVLSGEKSLFALFSQVHVIADVVVIVVKKSMKKN